MKKLVVLTGAGISAESGIKTFRDSGGLWEQHDVMDVASIDGWYRNPSLVLEFYNQRRKQLESAHPNRAHVLLAELEKDFDVQIITQNVDNLHERAGSRHVLHLHGELTKVRSSKSTAHVEDIVYREIHPGDLCADGSQLRPHIVWFGEAVPLIEEAERLVSEADIFAVIGTSLNVYPAADLVTSLPQEARAFLIDPNTVARKLPKQFTVIKENATVGVERMIQLLGG
ncbi:MAG: NAD-dependent deacylase [Synergistaceae bacterium]|nr:NAD-dependent deacylase [Synergistaceae bacterium]